MMMLFIVFGSFAQKFYVPSYYKTTELNQFPIRIVHSNSFNTKEEAVNFHKTVMAMNGIDTSTTSVEWELDAPIFSSFLHYNDKKTAIVTYVNKNAFNTYTSCFMECENVTFDLFESDGYMLTQRKIK
jgi:hypothetical protein